MSVCLLLIHDGRDDCLAETLVSLEHLHGWRDHVIVNDAEHKLGFAGAIAEGWLRILALDERADYVFHLEGDFRLLEPVPLAAMVRLLKVHPELAQVSLKRQPWSRQEVAAGGIVEANPDAFDEVREHGLVWTEHRMYFTTNPSVYRTGLCELGWPQCSQSEGMFTHRLLAGDPQLRFAIWGRKHDPPRVEHIGERVGIGY